jgi:hypothetical protein
MEGNLHKDDLIGDEKNKVKQQIFFKVDFRLIVSNKCINLKNKLFLEFE